MHTSYVRCVFTQCLLFVFIVAEGCAYDSEICDLAEDLRNQDNKIGNLTEQYEVDFASHSSAFLTVRDVIYK